MFVLDDYSSLRELAKEELAGTQLFPVSDALQFSRIGNHGYSRKGTFGDNFYSADNPAYGAAFDLYLDKKLSTAKADRKAKNSTAYPDAETLKKEDFEKAPSLFVQIKNTKGEIMANTRVANKKGFQRVYWSLNTSLKSADYPDQEMRLNKIPAGKYSAQLFAFQNGELQSLSKTQSFSIKNLDLSPEPAAADWQDFYQQVAQTNMAAVALDKKLDEGLKKVETQINNLLTSTQAEEKLKALEAKRISLKDLQYMLNGNETKESRFQYYLPGVRDRLRRVSRAQNSSTQITQTSRDNFVIAQQLLKEVEKSYAEIMKD
jgi:hypothetical protein